MTNRYELDKYKNEIIDLYINKKMSCKNISNKLGYSLNGIYDALKRWNIEMRNLRESHKIYCFNENYFKIVDSSEKAYWLGFIYADGYVTGKNFGIALSVVDITHLMKFKESIKASYPIRTYFSKSPYKSIEYCRMILNSKSFVSDLKDKGVINNKSLVIEFPNEEILNKKFYKDFIRGYFDGDGSLILSKNSINFKICGTKEFLEKLIEIFNEISDYEFKNRLFKRKKDEKNNYYLSYGGKYKTLSIMTYLYYNSQLYLERKYIKYLCLKSMN